MAALELGTGGRAGRLGCSPGTVLALASRIASAREHRATSRHRTSFQIKYEPVRGSALGGSGEQPWGRAAKLAAGRQSCRTCASLVPARSGPLRLSRCHRFLGATFRSCPLPAFARFLATGHKVAVFWLSGRRGKASFGCFY